MSRPPLNVPAWDDREGRPKYLDLDLTQATLNAILKYPWKRGENGPKSTKKWGVYASEADDFEFARMATPAGDKNRCLEAEIMNWADDVTYCVHDMEDFYRAGLIPLDRLRTDDRVRQKFYEGAFSRQDGEAALAVKNGKCSRAELEQAFETIVKIVPVAEPYSGTSEQRCRLRSLTSSLIGMYIHAATLHKPPDGSGTSLLLDPERARQVMMGKELTWQFVIFNPALGAQQQGHRTIIRGLFNLLSSAAKENQFTAFPISAREAVEAAESEDDRLRALVDLIAGMTEQQAIQMYQRLAGISLGSVLVNFVR